MSANAAILELAKRRRPVQPQGVDPAVLELARRRAPARGPDPNAVWQGSAFTEEQDWAQTPTGPGQEAPPSSPPNRQLITPSPIAGFEVAPGQVTPDVLARIRGAAPVLPQPDTNAMVGRQEAIADAVSSIGIRRDAPDIQPTPEQQQGAAAAGRSGRFGAAILSPLAEGFSEAESNWRGLYEHFHGLVSDLSPNPPPHVVQEGSPIVDSIISPEEREAAAAIGQQSGTVGHMAGGLIGSLPPMLADPRSLATMAAAGPMAKGLSVAAEPILARIGAQAGPKAVAGMNKLIASGNTGASFMALDAASRADWSDPQAAMEAVVNAAVNGAMIGYGGHGLHAGAGRIMRGRTPRAIEAEPGVTAADAIVAERSQEAATPVAEPAAGTPAVAVEQVPNEQVRPLEPPRGLVTEREGEILRPVEPAGPAPEERGTLGAPEAIAPDLAKVPVERVVDAAQKDVPIVDDASLPVGIDRPNVKDRGVGLRPEIAPDDVPLAVEEDAIRTPTSPDIHDSPLSKESINVPEVNEQGKPGLPRETQEPAPSDQEPSTRTAGEQAPDAAKPELLTADQPGPWRDLAERVLRGETSVTKARREAGGFQLRFTEAYTALRDGRQIQPVREKTHAESIADDSRREREWLNRPSVESVARSAVRPGWTVDYVSDSGSTYLKHDASGRIVRVADHAIPESPLVERRKWDEDLTGGRGGMPPSKSDVVEAMNRIEEIHAEENATPTPVDHESSSREGAASVTERLAAGRSEGTTAPTGPQDPKSMNLAALRREVQALGDTPVSGKAKLVAQLESLRSEPEWAKGVPTKDLRKQAAELGIRNRGARAEVVSALRGKKEPQTITDSITSVETGRPGIPTESPKNPTSRTLGAQDPGETISGPVGTKGTLFDTPGLKTDTTGAKSETPGAERYFQRVAREAAERIKARGNIPHARNRGGGPLVDDVLDAGIWLAAKFGDTGDRFFRSQAGYARKLIDENYPHLSERFGDVARLARKLIRESADPEAKVHKFDEGRFEAALSKVLADAKGPPRPVKQIIREKTGQRKVEEKTITASEALVRGLRKEERAANRASRAQRRTDLAETRNRIDVLRQDLESRARSRGLRGAITERAKGEMEVQKVQTYTERLKDLRGRATDVIERSPFRDVRAKFLRSIENVKTLGQLRRLMGKVERATVRKQLSLEVADVRSALRRTNTRKMFEHYRDEIKQARAELKMWQVDPRTLKRYKTLTDLDQGLDTVKDIAYRVAEARHRDRADRKILVEGKAIARQTAVDEVTAGIKTRKELAKESLPLPVDREASFAGRAKQAMATPDTVGAMMRSNMARKILAEDPWDGENLVLRDSQKADDSLRKNLEQAGYTWGSDKLQRLSAAAAGKEADVITIKLPDAGEIKATPAEWMALYATITDKKAAVNIANGAPIRWRRARGESSAEFKLTYNDAGSLIYELDPKLREVVDRAKKYVEKEIRPGLFEAFREQKGYDLEAVEGYWRTKRDMLSQDNPGLIGTMRQQFNQALENLGFLKERSPDRTKPYLIGDFFDDFHDMAHQGAVVTHMTRRVRNAELVFSNAEMRQVVQAHFGRGMNKRIADIIEGQKLIFTPPKTTAERFASMLNRNFARAKLTLNPRTMVKQLGGTFKLLSKVNYWDWVNGLSHAYSADVTKILETSPYFRERYENAIWRRMSPTLGDRTPLLGKSSVRDTLGRGMKGWLFTSKAGRAALGDLIDRIELLNKFDAVAARTAIGTKLAEAKRLKVADPAKWAEREASMLIRRTNNTNSVLDMSGFASEHRKTVGWTPVLMFTSDSNKSFNLLAAAASEGKTPFAKAVFAVALDAAFGAAIATLLGAEGYKLIAGGKDDKKEREGLAERWGWAFARNLSSVVYGADTTIDLARASADVFRGMPVMEVRIVRNPVGETMEDFAKGLLKLAEAAGAEGRFQSGPRMGQSRKVGKLLEGLEKAGLAGADMLGIPISPLYGQTKSIIKAAQ